MLYIRRVPPPLVIFFRGFWIYFCSVVGYTKQEKEEEKNKTGRKETS